MRTLFPSYLGTAVQKEPTFNTRLGKWPSNANTNLVMASQWKMLQCSCYIIARVTRYCSARVKYFFNEWWCAKFGRERHKPTVHAAQALQCGKRFWLHQLLEIQKSGVRTRWCLLCSQELQNGTFRIIVFNFYVIVGCFWLVWCWCSWPFGQPSWGNWARDPCEAGYR